MRWIAIAGGVLLCLLLGAAAAGYVWRVELAESGIRWALSRAGVEEAAFRIDHVDLSGLTLVEIAIGDAVRAERIDVAFDLGRLPAPPFQRIRVVGGEIDVVADAGGGGDTPSVAAATDGPGLEVPLAILPVLEIERGRVRLPSAAGPLLLEVDSRVEPHPGFVETTLEGTLSGEAGSAHIEGRARLDEAGPVSISMDVRALDLQSPSLTVSGGTVSLRLTGRSKGLELERADGSLEVRLGGVTAGGSVIGDLSASLPFALTERDERWVATLTHARLELPGQGLDAKAVSGETSLHGFDLKIDRLVDTSRRRRFEPLSLRLRVPKTDPEVPFSVDVVAAGGRATMRAFGRYEPSTQTLRAEVIWPRFELDPENLRPRDLSPRLAFDGALAGALEGRALLTWTSDAGLQGTATVSVDEGRLVTDAIRIEGVSGRVVVDGFDPLSTRGLQLLSAREIHPGVPLSDVTARLALEPADGPGSRLRIARFECGFAGGDIVVEDARIDPGAAENEIEFRFEGVDVAKLFEIAAIDGVSGTGTVSGRVPVAVRGSAVAMGRGRLASGGGVLRVRSDAARGMLSGAGESAELLLEALRDFHYESLVVEIEKDFEGEARVLLGLEGANPALLDGHPFRVNLNLTGNLEHLVRSLLEVARLSDRAVRATVGAALEDRSPGPAR